MNMRNLFLTLAFGLCSGIFAQNTTVFESPIMGWSSWNTYRVHINDTLIIRQADAMVQKGLKEVGYSYVNVDDGFFGWRDERGVMQTHPERFPNGLKGVADHIHSLGLKAGIYSDAGSNTCNIGYVTLHVGLGTFRPVKADDILEHKMHSEFYILPQETADLVNKTKSNGKRVISVGRISRYCR